MPVAPHNFYLLIEGYPLRVTFILDEEGQGEYFRTRPFVGKRLEAGTMSAAKHVQVNAFDPDRLLRMLRLYPQEGYFFHP